MTNDKIIKKYKTIALVILLIMFVYTFVFSSNKNINKLKADVNSSDNATYDVVLFWGQSNMVGYAGINDEEKLFDQRIYSVNSIPKYSEYTLINSNLIHEYSRINHVNVNLESKTAYEYKYSTNSLVELTKDTETLGETLEYVNGDLVNTGNITIYRSYGTNMIPEFARTYYEKTGHKVIAVFAARGGRAIDEFLPGTPLYNAMVKKYSSAVKYLNDRNIKIGNKFYVVMQGETDVSHNTSINDYMTRFKSVHNGLKNDLGLQFGVLTETSRQNGYSNITSLENIHTAQENLINNNQDIIKGSDYAYTRFVPDESNYHKTDLDYATALSRANLSMCPGNNGIHFTSLSLSYIGYRNALAAYNSQKIEKTKVTVTFHKNDGTNKTATQVLVYGDSNNRFGYNTDGTPKWDQTGQFGGWDREGYKLLGWSKNANDTVSTWNIYSSVVDSWIQKNEPSIDLYAIWQKTITIPTCSDKTYNTQSQTLFSAHSGNYTNSVLKGTNAGSYQVTLELSSGNYWSDNTDENKILTCKINPYNISNATISGITTKKYTGSAITPNPIVKALSTTLTKNTDYTVSYSNNINVGTATITITGKGNYTGTKTVTFKIENDNIDLSDLNIKDNEFVILNKNSTKTTITNVVGQTGIKIFDGDTEITSSTKKLKTGNILKANTDEYSIVILGDPNMDGEIDIGDLAKIYKISKNPSNYTRIEKISADANDDGDIDIGDITKTYKLSK